MSRVTIWRWIRDGRLRANRLGHRTIRISRDDLERTLTQAGPGGPRPWGVRRAATDTEAAVVPVTWPSARPAASEHVVQFYETDAFLLKAVRDFVGSALRDGEAAVVIATQAHLDGLEQRLEASGIDLDVARACGQYVGLDAADTLSKLMLDGMPDPGRFDEIVGGLVRRTRVAHRGLKAFGEMVALLALAGNYEAVTRLEQLWNELGQVETFSLLCAYPMDQLDGEAASALLDEVCAEHSHVIPAESYAGLPSHEEQQRAIVLLQQKAATLEAEIAERERAEQALRDAVRVRDEFLSIASHELRTPLTTVRALSQLMLRRLDKRGQLDSEGAQYAFQTISDQSGKLTRLIEQLLDVSRLGAGKLTLEPAATDLRALLERVAAAADLRTTKHIAVEATGTVVAMVDPLRLDQLLTNLVDNAIKYGAEDDRIELGLARLADGRVEISVRDHGPGIPEAARDGIFERFFQGCSERHQTGMGLGLYISRQIAELHGGRIEAEFPDDGGTRFRIRLPAALVVAAATEAADLAPASA